MGSESSAYNRDVDIDALNRLRAKQRWTIPVLAAHAGLSESMVGKILGGHRRCSLTTAEKLADALGVQPEAFLLPRRHTAA